MSTVLVWLVIIALLLVALARIGIAVRNAPWLNADRPGQRMDAESKRFVD